MTNEDGLYDLIYEYLEQNPMEIGNLLLIFEQIKFEQLTLLKDEDQDDRQN